MLIQGICLMQMKKKILITEFLVMTVLKYNHNSLLLIRASRLVPPLLFVVSMVPWVCITLPRQTQGKAQMLLHWSNKFCCVSARSGFLTVLPTHLWSRAGLGGSSSDWSILLSSAFLYSAFFVVVVCFSFVFPPSIPHFPLGAGVGFPYSFIPIGDFPCCPINFQRKTFPILLRLKKIIPT